MKLTTLLALLLYSLNSFGLSFDEKLIFKIVSTSSSKRTVLINKGEEDGLKNGDQAKFIKKDGTSYALAIVRKTSPSRSLWSVYRINSSTELHKGNVTQLKIIKPAKLTVDSSKLILGDKPISIDVEKTPIVQPPETSDIVSYRDVNNFKKYRNYSSLEDHFTKKRDPSVSWKNLDKDDFPYTEKIKIKNTTVSDTYRNLEVKPLPMKMVDKEYASLSESKLFKINKKEIEKAYSSLEDFNYR
ncbi:MAG: hypothetical protein ACO20H_01865 [Bacteriovoracaceae bacterium]